MRTRGFRRTIMPEHGDCPHCGCRVWTASQGVLLQEDYMVGVRRGPHGPYPHASLPYRELVRQVWAHRVCVEMVKVRKGLDTTVAL